MTLTITSPDFKHNGLIPAKFTCDGEDISPLLQWAGVPEGTVSFVLICDDPDAPMGTWDHWLLFNLPGDTTELPEAVAVLPTGTREGNNSWGKIGYGGPCPPDKVHRYFFKLYALDGVLTVDDGVTKAEIESAMEGHVLGQAELMARYDRVR